MTSADLFTPGVAAAMKKLPILDFTDHYGFKLPAIVDSNGNPQTAPQTYTLKNGDVPTLYYRWALIQTRMPD